MTDTKLRVAVVQAAPVFMDAAASTDKAIDLIAEAAAQGARLVGFPEVWIPGYPWWVWLGAPAWSNQFVGRLHQNALRADGPELERIRLAAAKHGVNVVLGFVERDGDSLYISQAIIDETGKTLLNRRKLKPTHVERTVFGEGDGSDLEVVTTPIGRVGALCCAEHVQPLSKYAMYAQHEQIHVASWPAFTLYKGLAYALGAEVNLAASQVYALEGGCFVLHATSVIGQDVYEMLCDTPERQALMNSAGAKPGGGFSMIFGPDGRPLVDHLPEDQEGLLYADIDLGEIAIAKSVLDPTGHYARADATKLLINRNPRRPVIQNGVEPPPTLEEL